jgi:hypothetical protein
MYEQRLQENIVQGYNTLVRPVEINEDQLVVRLGLKLIQLLDVVSNEQIFQFYYLIYLLKKIKKDEKNQILTTKVWLKHVKISKF